MKSTVKNFSTGLAGLDQVLQGILPGDNIVWLINSVQDYRPFVESFSANAVLMGKKLIYFRFAQHAQLLYESPGVTIVHLNAEKGFERFINEIFDVIEEAGRGACFVFDCLTELLADWNSDRMLSNFFLLTCPYLYTLKTVAYFSLIRNRHSSHATDGIYEKAQIILDVYQNKDKYFIHPVKVHKRYSDTLYKLHVREGDYFLPVSNSATVSEILAGVPQPWLDFTTHRLGEWTSTFSQAAELHNDVRMGKAPPSDLEPYYRRIMRMTVTRDKRILELAEAYLDFSDLLEIRKRMIGTGLIGGKTVGMLMARAMLIKKNKRWKELLEAHDSFYIGSDVFYTYLVQNDCWWVRRKPKSAEAVIEKAELAHEKMLKGRFPQYIKDQFMEMLNYFGQVPIIVRSSSLLEDNYGNSFSGKYESVFCANQGTPIQRLEAFVNAVRTVYASTMSREALMYRAQKGLLHSDEQMALLVQRVSGDVYGELFFPQVAGVGYSFNPYVWNTEIDPKQGMLRLVFGLGTRAVDRHDDDYTRIVALNVPNKRPESNFTQVRRYAQQKVDVLNLRENREIALHFYDVLASSPNLPLPLFASKDAGVEQMVLEKGIDPNFLWVLTFEGLFAETPFIQHMKEMLALLQEAYQHPVDIEFSLNVLAGNTYRINLLQCRPFQVKIEKSMAIEFPKDVKQSDILFKTNGPILGNSVVMPVDRIVYVVPSAYSGLPQSERYAVARLIGTITHREQTKGQKIMLLGPGRWGTTTPSLGVPISFSEINTVSVLCEIAMMHEGLIPDMSLGTHFYNDLVEMDLLYLGIQPDRNENFLNIEFLNTSPNLLETCIPDCGKWLDTIRVMDCFDHDRKIILYIDSPAQKALCYAPGP